MRAASNALVAHATTAAVTFVADLVTLELQSYAGQDAARGMTIASGNTVCRWTTGDTPLSPLGQGVTFYPNGPPMKRGSVRHARGLEVSNMNLSLGGAGWSFPDGRSLALAAIQGVFDGAKVRVERQFMPTWGDMSLGTLRWFDGKVGVPDISSTEVKLNFKCIRDELSLPMPKRLYLPGCPYAVFSPACGLSKASYLRNTVVRLGSTAQELVVNTSEVVGTNGYYNLGWVRFTSGVLIGTSRMARGKDGFTVMGATSVIALEVPLPIQPAEGTTFSLYPGCDHTKGTCESRYNNLGNYGGFPYVPKPESMR